MVIHKAIGVKAFRPRTSVNAAVVDSLMVGVANRIASKGRLRTDSQLNHLAQRYQRLLKAAEYVDAVETGTAQEAKVEARLRLAREAFKVV